MDDELLSRHVVPRHDARPDSAGASLAFLFVPINAMAFRGITCNKTNNASALDQPRAQFRRQYRHLVRLHPARRVASSSTRAVWSNTVQPLNGAYPDYASQLAHALGTTPDSATTLASLYQQVNVQATLLSYLEDFKVVGLIFLALLPLLFFVRPSKGAGAGMAH